MWEAKVQQLIRRLTQPYDYLMTCLDPFEQQQLTAFRMGSASVVDMEFSLRQLCEWLHRFHGEKVVILIDGKFRVENNREAAESRTTLGRADLLIAPLQPGQPGAVLELKVAIKGKKTLKKALAEGEAQQLTRLYASALETSGAHPIHRWVVAFDGKVVKVKWMKGGEEAL